LRDGHVQRTGGNGQAVDVAQLALIGAEAQRGVALDVLDRLEAFAGRQFDGGGGDVVLQVDELLRRRAVPLSCGTWNSATVASSRRSGLWAGCRRRP
jgi:hypothetical protein